MGLGGSTWGLSIQHTADAPGECNGPPALLPIVLCILIRPPLHHLVLFLFPLISEVMSYHVTCEDSSGYNPRTVERL